MDQEMSYDYQSARRYAWRLEQVNTRLRRRLDAAIRKMAADNEMQRQLYEELRNTRGLRKLNEELQQQRDEARFQVQLLERENLRLRRRLDAAIRKIAADSDARQLLLYEELQASRGLRKELAEARERLRLLERENG